MENALVPVVIRFAPEDYPHPHFPVHLPSFRKVFIDFPIIQEQLCHLHRGAINELMLSTARNLSIDRVIFIDMIETERGTHAPEPRWLARDANASTSYVRRHRSRRCSDNPFHQFISN